MAAGAAHFTQKIFSVILTHSDDLGRVVIPKEIRRTLRLREGTPLEIFTDREGEIILKKYSPMAELGSFAKQYAESLAQTTGYAVCVTDRDTVIAAAGGMKKEFVGKPISKQLETLILNRDVSAASRNDKEFVMILAGEDGDFQHQVIYPIICEGDAIGSVAILSRETKVKMGETEQKLAYTAAAFLGRQMES